MPTIEGLDAGQIELPAEMLSIDLAEVRHKKGVLVSGFAELRVDILDTLAESFANQLLGQVLSIAMVKFMTVVVRDMINRRLHKDMTVRVLWIVEWGEAIGDNSRHNHNSRFGESGDEGFRKETRGRAREKTDLSRLIGLGNGRSDGR